jgi:hypothetical protein
MPKGRVPVFVKNDRGQQERVRDFATLPQGRPKTIGELEMPLVSRPIAHSPGVWSQNIGFKRGGVNYR